jgi:hypothetical protein
MWAGSKKKLTFLQSPRKDKFSRFESGSEDEESEEEEEEVETETEVEVTDSEGEAESAAKPPETEVEKARDASARGDDDDVLNVDCRDEVTIQSTFILGRTFLYRNKDY